MAKKKLTQKSNVITKGNEFIDSNEPVMSKESTGDQVSNKKKNIPIESNNNLSFLLLGCA